MVGLGVDDIVAVPIGVIPFVGSDFSGVIGLQPTTKNINMSKVLLII